jgi:hypothetical protein
VPRTRPLFPRYRQNSKWRIRKEEEKPRKGVDKQRVGLAFFSECDGPAREERGESVEAPVTLFLLAPRMRDGCRGKGLSMASLSLTSENIRCLKDDASFPQ